MTLEMMHIELQKLVKKVEILFNLDALVDHNGNEGGFLEQEQKG